MELNNLLLFILGQLIAGAAIWGAIRADLRNIHFRIDRMERVQDTDRSRLDRHLEVK